MVLTMKADNVLSRIHRRTFHSIKRVLNPGDEVLFSEENFYSPSGVVGIEKNLIVS